MSGLIQVVEDYESEDEGLDILFGDTTEIPQDRRKQITQENVTIPELRRMIEQKEKDRLEYEEALKNDKFRGPKVEEDSTESEEEDFDTRQITYQGQNYILTYDNIVITDGMEVVGEWDPVKNKIFNWEEDMFQKHLKNRGPWRRKDEKY